MAKALRQVTIENPSVDYIHPGVEKDFARKHKVLKTMDANGNGDDVFNASKVKVSPRKSYANSASVESSPKDSYGYGDIRLYPAVRTIEPALQIKNMVNPTEAINLFDFTKQVIETYLDNPDEDLDDVITYVLMEYHKDSSLDNDLGSEWGKQPTTKKRQELPNVKHKIHDPLKAKKKSKKDDHGLGSKWNEEEIKESRGSDWNKAEFKKKAPTWGGNFSGVGVKVQKGQKSNGGVSTHYREMDKAINKAIGQEHKPVKTTHYREMSKAIGESGGDDCHPKKWVDDFKRDAKKMQDKNKKSPSLIQTATKKIVGKSKKKMNEHEFESAYDRVAAERAMQGHPVRNALLGGATAGLVGGYMINRATKRAADPEYDTKRLSRNRIIGGVAAGAGLGAAIGGIPGAIAGAGLSGAILASLGDDIKAVSKILRNRRDAKRAAKSGRDAVAKELDYDFLSHQKEETVNEISDTLKKSYIRASKKDYRKKDKEFQKQSANVNNPKGETTKLWGKMVNRMIGQNRAQGKKWET